MATSSNSNTQNNLNNLPLAFRVGGSGFTVFHWMNYVVGFAQMVGNQSPQPVAQPSAIQPMDQQYPLQILVPAATGPGTIQLQLFESYNQKVWDQIMKITDTVDSTSGGILSQYNNLAEIFLRLSAVSQPINCTKLVYPPNTGFLGGTGSNVNAYADTFYNCMVTDVRDDESIQVGSMEITKSITISYTYHKRSQQNS